MTISIDHARARIILTEAVTLASQNAYRVSARMETKIEQIINHTHLTYKYVLLTGMLAKATNPNANPLVLQAGSPLDGAFDARSLCHSVVVPFEQTVLEKRLGGSNEPFLNKPARYQHLGMENAVRRGKDRETLERLIAAFEMVNANENGPDALVAVLSHILRLESRLVVFENARFDAVASKRALLRLVQNILSQSCEGESLALCVALLFEILSKSQRDILKVVSHPANQSGASSNEVSDIDVFDINDNTLLYCCEAKDKPFSRADIDHAISKVTANAHGSMLFIFGPNARTDEDLNLVANDYEQRGFDLTFLDISAFADGIVALSPVVPWIEVADLINKHLSLMRVKETTISHFRDALHAL